MDMKQHDERENQAQDCQISFLYKAIDDAQNVVKLIDTKAAIALAPIGFMLNTLISGFHLTCASVWQGYLVLFLGLSLVATSFLIYKVLFPMINPLEQVGMPTNLQPAFFVSEHRSRRWQSLFSGLARYSRLSQTHAEYLEVLGQSDKNQIRAVLVGELLKVAYIRNMKMFRLRAVGRSLVFSTVIFLVAYAVVPEKARESKQPGLDVGYSPETVKIAAPQPAAGGAGKVGISSSPANAAVYVDGKFTGNAPASLSLSIGPHHIVMKVEGYKDWERTLEVMRDSDLSLNATLSAVAAQPTATPPK